MSTRIAKSKSLMRKAPSQSRSRATVGAIVEAATRILAAQGWAAFTTNKVAEAAGVTGELPRLLRAMENEDMLYIVSDHGNDPTFEGTSHTREYVPLLVYSRMFRPRRQANLGVRATLADVAETIADSYDLNLRYAATSFWENMISQL